MLYITSYESEISKDYGENEDVKYFYKL